MDDTTLVEKALAVRTHAYAPYSGFSVGAALLGENGIVYPGCNVENAALSPGCCAERAAFFRAIADGERKFKKIAVVGGKAGEPAGSFCPPCGVCRQVMAEFCDPDTFLIILAKSPSGRKRILLRDLFPMGFGKAEVSFGPGKSGKEASKSR